MMHEWEMLSTVVERTPEFGLGMAVSGGIDSPDSDTDIVVSDVLMGGPADGKLCVNDRIHSVNGIPLSSVTHGQAIHYLKMAGSYVDLVLRRRRLSQVHSSQISLMPHQSTLRQHSRPPSHNHHQSSVSLVHSAQRTPYTSNHVPYPSDYRASAPDLVSKGGYHRSNALALRIPGFAPTLVDNTSPDGAREVRLHRRDRLDNLGVELSCCLRVSDVAPGSAAELAGVQVGDTVLGMNGIQVANVSLVDARNLLRRQDIRLCLVSQKETSGQITPVLTRRTPPTRREDSKSLERSHRRNHQDGPADHATGTMRVELIRGVETGQRRSPGENVTNSSRGSRSNNTTNASECNGITRVVRFHKAPRQGAGIRLTGGNVAGIFLAGVHPNSVAAEHGLIEGDLLMTVNGEDMSGKTKEEAVLALVSLESEVELAVRSAEANYHAFLTGGDPGDSFFVRTHFEHSAPGPQGAKEDNDIHLSFRRGYVFHVRDSLYGGVVGSWQAVQVHPRTAHPVAGIIPNAHRAEQLALASSRGFPSNDGFSTWGHSRGRAAKMVGLGSSLGGSLMRRKRSKSQTGGLDSQPRPLGSPAYERVQHKRTGFLRPVVLFGPLADLARERLLRDLPERFDHPMPGTAAQNNAVDGDTDKQPGLIKLTSIKEVIERQKHCILDITPAAVERLILAQYAPMVVLLRPTSKSELRHMWPGGSGGLTASKRVKRVWRDMEQLEEQWSHIFTDRLPVSGPEGDWLPELLDTIRHRQGQMEWLSENSESPLSSSVQDLLLRGSSLGSRSTLGEGVESTLNLSRTSVPDHQTSPREAFLRSLSDPYLLDMPLAERREMEERLPKQEREQKSLQTDVPDGDVHPNPIFESNVNLPGRPRLEEPTDSRCLANITNNRDDLSRRPTNGVPRDDNLVMHGPTNPDLTSRDPANNNKSSLGLTNGDLVSRSPGNGETAYDLYQCARSSAMLKSGHPRPEGPQDRITNELQQMFKQQTQVPHQSYRPVPSTLSRTGINSNYQDANSQLGTSSKDKRESNSSRHTADYSHRSDPLGAPSPSTSDSLFTPPNHRTVTSPVPNHRSRSPVVSPSPVREHTASPPMEDPEVIAEASGVFDHMGGRLEVPDSKVSLIIPPGALPHSVQQKIFIKIYQDASCLPSLHAARRASLVSPLVMCGPHGLRFLSPVQLRLPHRPAAPDNTHQWTFSLLHASSDSGTPNEWRELELDRETGVARVDDGTVAVMVDHF